MFIIKNLNSGISNLRLSDRKPIPFLTEKLAWGPSRDEGWNRPWEWSGGVWPCPWRTPGHPPRRVGWQCSAWRWWIDYRERARLAGSQMIEKTPVDSSTINASMLPEQSKVCLMFLHAQLHKVSSAIKNDRARTHSQKSTGPNPPPEKRRKTILHLKWKDQPIFWQIRNTFGKRGEARWVDISQN